MVEKLRVTIRASSAHPDVLTVQDAMQQVLDIFTLLEAAQQHDSFVWRLSFASTNSPFIAEGEAVSFQPGVDISVMARAERSELVQAFTDLTRGEPALAWADTPKSQIAERVMKRNQNGVGITEIQHDPKKPSIVLNPVNAALALRTFTPTVEIRPSLYPPRGARKERGSVEGQIQHVGTYYNSPAFRLKERKTGNQIWCGVSAALQDKIARQADYTDVWQHRRVIVRGTLQYDSSGTLCWIIADGVERITPRKVTPSELRDTNFTGGLSITEYLDKFREGELG